MSRFTKKLLITAISSTLLASSSSLFATTLQDAVRQTVCSNPEVGVHVKRVLADTQRVGQARSGYFPKVDVNAGFGREKSENSSNGFDTANLWRKELGITGRQMLFDGFATSSEVARTKAATDADAFQVWSTSEDMGLKTAEAYLNVLRTREIVAAAQRNLNLHQNTFGMIRKLSESGVGREADTDQAAGRFALARANLIAAQSDERDAITTYQQIVGSEPTNLLMPPAPRPVDLPQSLNAAISFAVSNHPVLRSANADIREAKAQYDASKAAFYPRLDLVANANRNRNLDGVRGPNNDLSGMLQLQYNVLRGGGDIARSNETAYQVQEAKAVRDRTYRQVVENMRLAWSALTTSQSRLPYLASHSKDSQQTLSAYGQQFQLGKRNLLDVLDSQNELFTSQTAYINGKYDVIDAKYRVLNAEGRLLSFFHINIPSQAMIHYASNED